MARRSPGLLAVRFGDGSDGALVMAFAWLTGPTPPGLSVGTASCKLTLLGSITIIWHARLCLIPRSMPAQLTSSLKLALSRFRVHLAHAFATPKSDDVLSIEDLALLERMAETVVRRGMAAPAALVLESVAPLNFLGSQLLYTLTPLLNMACDASEFERAARLLERRDTVSRLAALMEAKSTVAASR